MISSSEFKHVRIADFENNDKLLSEIYFTLREHERYRKVIEKEEKHRFSFKEIMLISVCVVGVFMIIISDVCF